MVSCSGSGQFTVCNNTPLCHADPETSGEASLDHAPKKFGALQHVTLSIIIRRSLADALDDNM